MWTPTEAWSIFVVAVKTPPAGAICMPRGACSLLMDLFGVPPCCEHVLRCVFKDGGLSKQMRAGQVARPYPVRCPGRRDTHAVFWRLPIFFLPWIMFCLCSCYRHSEPDSTELSVLVRPRLHLTPVRCVSDRRTGNFLELHQISHVCATR
ncbi:unnamed protein product [Scytosiphon promiscuus]